MLYVVKGNGSWGRLMTSNFSICTIFYLPQNGKELFRGICQRAVLPFAPDGIWCKWNINDISWWVSPGSLHGYLDHLLGWWAYPDEQTEPSGLDVDSSILMQHDCNLPHRVRSRG